MAKTPASRREKGKRLERKVASELRRCGLDPKAQRMPRSGAMTHFRADVLTELPYHFECKAQETIRFWDFWTQASGSAPSTEAPILCISANHRPILAVVELDTLLNLLLCEQQLNDSAQSLTNAAVAQRTEHGASTPGVVGSNPPGGAKSKWKRKVSGETVLREDT